MGKQLGEVCKELDDISLRILRLMELLIQKKVRLDELMKPGFLDMAKARYIMGNKKVSSLQLPTENSDDFTSQCTVTSSVDDALGYTLYKLNNMSLNYSKPCSEKPKLRNRKVECDEPERTDLPNGIESVKIVDPLKWFGVLVPQNLRRAQTCFQTTLELIAEIATIQSELHCCQNKFKELSQSKSSLLE